MGKKKRVEQDVEQSVVEQLKTEQSVVEQLKTGPANEPIYLRETLMEMDEIKQYGLNKYFLMAILKNRYYTLPEALELLEDATKH